MKLKNFLKGVLLGTVLVGIMSAGISYAQIGSLNFFKKVGNDVSLIKDTWTLKAENASFANLEIGGTVTGSLQFPDDVPLYLGDNDDASIKFASTEDALKLESSTTTIGASGDNAFLVRENNVIIGDYSSLESSVFPMPDSSTALTIFGAKTNLHSAEFAFYPWLNGTTVDWSGYSYSGQTGTKWRRAGGSYDSPTTVSNGELVYSQEMYGYHEQSAKGTKYERGASWKYYTDADISTSSAEMPMRAELYLTPDNSITEELVTLWENDKSMTHYGSLSVTSSVNTQDAYYINGYQVLDSDNSNFFYSDSVLPTNGVLNTVVGKGAGANIDGAIRNNFYGYLAGRDCTTCSKNQAFGVTALANITTGVEAVAVGNQTLSGGAVTDPDGTVAIGYQSGLNAIGDYNVFLGHQSGYFETGNNKLYIANSTTTNPLIYGEFDNDYLKINGDLDVTGYTSGLKSGVFAYLSTASTTEITTAGTFYSIVGTFINDPVENFSAATTYTPGIKYDGTKTQYFEIIWNAEISGDALNTNVTVSVSKNGTVFEGAGMQTRCFSAGEPYNLSGTAVLELAQNDEVQLVVTSDGSGDDITFYKFTTSIKEFFD